MNPIQILVIYCIQTFIIISYILLPFFLLFYASLNFVNNYLNHCSNYVFYCYPFCRKDLLNYGYELRHKTDNIMQRKHRNKIRILNSIIIYKLIHGLIYVVHGKRILQMSITIKKSNIF